jgi:crossover junction endodeoxyribonuclease RuvC
MSAETIVSVDPALRAAGYAVLRRENQDLHCVAFGVLRNGAKMRASGCLLALHEGLTDIIQRHEPQAMAVEGVIFVQSYQTAITLGAARGAVILAAVRRGLPVHEYAPRRVKQAVVGRGAADKRQVAFMVRVLLRMRQTPPADAADAMAIGITHFQALDAARAKQATLPSI